MQAFIADKEIIEFTEHFFVHNKIPYLTVILSYRDMDQDRRKMTIRDDPRKELDDKEKEAYDALRAWRSERARQEGIPPYMIANNKQIARMIKIRATSISGLADIKGFGESKTSHYGEEILEILNRHLKADYNKKNERSGNEKEIQE